MSSTYLTRTNGTETTRTKCTFSAWFKFDQYNATNTIIVATDDSGANTYFQIELKPDIDVQIRDGSSTTYLRRRSNAKLRDASGWYNVVVTWDSTLGTAADRLKVFLNGERITSFNDNTGTVDSNYNCPLFKSSIPMKIGVGQSGSSNFFSGIMSHIHATDGYAYEASAFGSTDADTGEWTINTSPSVTYGDNGFFILKNGNSVTDQSGEGNNWTVGGGTLTNTEDCPSDVFATWNILGATAVNYKNANNTIYNSTNWQNSYSTLGMTKGKYYAEFKTLTDDKAVVGINPINTSQSTITGISGTNNRWGYGDGARDGRVLTYNGGAGSKTTGGTDSTYSSGSISANDILMVAVDMDNYIIWTGVNGTWNNSATATEIENGTTTNAMFTGFNSTSDTWFFAGTEENSTLEANFGNGYFGTTQISSEGTNASGIGKFEYDVPTGYTALSTKGLNE